jgi:hypothetical protein
MSATLRSLSVALPLLCAHLAAQAGDSQAAETPASSNGAVPSGYCRSGIWSSTRDLDATERVGQIDCALVWNPSLGHGIRFGFNARGASTHGSAHYQRDRAYMRESFAALDLDKWSLKLGRQILSWGRTDRIGPTDYFSPRDLTALVADDDEQKLGTDALLIKHHLNQEMSVSVVAAKPSANRLPTALGVGALAPLERPNRPEYAIKLDRNSGQLDWSISLHKGFERSPYYQLDIAGPGLPTLHRPLPSTQSVGADMATSVGAWVMRAEAAYTKSTPGCATCGSVERNIGKLVLGIEREVGEHHYATAQLYGLNRSGYRAPETRSQALQSSYQAIDRLNSEFGGHEYGLTWRWTTKALNEALRLEFAGVLHAPRHQASSVALRPRVRYAVSDRLHVGAGVDRFIGRPQSYFGTRRANNLVFLELGYAF